MDAAGDVEKGVTDISTPSNDGGEVKFWKLDKFSSERVHSSRFCMVERPI
jgi:hypothetical protein